MVGVEGSEYCCRVESSKGRAPTNSSTSTSPTTINVGIFGYGISGLWTGNVTRMVKIAPA